MWGHQDETNIFIISSNNCLLIVQHQYYSSTVCIVKRKRLVTNCLIISLLYIMLSSVDHTNIVPFCSLKKKKWPLQQQFFPFSFGGERGLFQPSPSKRINYLIIDVYRTKDRLAIAIRSLKDRSVTIVSLTQVLV